MPGGGEHSYGLGLVDLMQWMLNYCIALQGCFTPIPEIRVSSYLNYCGRAPRCALKKGWRYNNFSFLSYYI